MFHALLQSGWIIQKTEFMQILEFLGIDLSLRAYEYHGVKGQVKRFVKTFCEELDFSVEDTNEILCGEK